MTARRGKPCVAAPSENHFKPDLRRPRRGPPRSESGRRRASPSAMRRYAAVLLDVDGPLVDSNDAHAHAWVEALHKHGFEVAFEEVRPMIGMGGDRVIEE